MKVKVIIRRRYSNNEQEALQPFLNELFRLVYQFEGFVAGEIFVDSDDPAEHLIISTWDSLNHWRSYHQSTRVRELCSMIDTIIGKQTTHRVFVQEVGSEHATILAAELEAEHQACSDGIG